MSKRRRKLCWRDWSILWCLWNYDLFWRKQKMALWCTDWTRKLHVHLTTIRVKTSFLDPSTYLLRMMARRPPMSMFQDTLSGKWSLQRYGPRTPYRPSGKLCWSIVYQIDAELIARQVETLEKNSGTRYEFFKWSITLISLFTVHLLLIQSETKRSIGRG